MMAMDDTALLQDYARTGSEPAFAALVERHVALVYSAALRQVREPHLAQDVTQVVFIILARKANRLTHHAVLSGWLLKTSRYAANAQIRAAARRSQREQEAYMQSTLNETSPAVWEQLAPLLDEAMTALGETDRNVLALRFFENKTAQEIGRVFQMNEDAAQRRVTRAIEKLRKFFVKRGIILPAAALTAAISANSVKAAPAALIKTTTAVALAKGATASASTLSIVNGTLKFIAWTKIKTVAAISAAIILAAGTSTVIIESRPDIQGAWEGTLVNGTQKERLVFKITKENGVYQATGDYIDLGIKDAPFSKFSYNQSALHFEGNNSQGVFNTFVFDATVDTDMSKLSGTWQQRGASGALVLKRTTQPDAVPDKLKDSDYAPRAGSDLQGFWAGTFDVETNSWLLYFKIAEQPDGAFHAEADGVNTSVVKVELLGQGYKNIPATLITYKQPTVDLEFNGIAYVFQGEVNNDKSEMTGTLKWGNRTIPLTMKRTDPSSEDPRVGPVVGIGVALDMDKQTGALRIMQVVPNSPAAQAGLTTGVVIQKVDDASIAGKSLDECLGLVRGVIGTKVRLEIITSDKTATNTVELVRQRIQP